MRPLGSRECLIALIAYMAPGPCSSGVIIGTQERELTQEGEKANKNDVLAHARKVSSM